MASDPVSTLLSEIKEQEAQRLEAARSEYSDINEQLTFGPVENNLSGSYSAGKGAWDLHFLDKVSPDLLVVMQSRMAQLYVKTDQPNQSPNIPRRVKDLIIRDFFPVQVVADLGREVTS